MSRRVGWVLWGSRVVAAALSMRLSWAMRNRGLPAALAAAVLLAAPTDAQDDALWKSLMEQSVAAREAGKLPEAQKHLEKALKEAEKFGPRDGRLAVTLNDLGVVYDAAGQLAKAEPLLKRAVTVYETALGENHPVAARGLLSLCINLRHQGRMAEAYIFLRGVASRLEKAGAGESPEMVAALGALAETQTGLGKPDRAEPLYTRAMGIVEKALGPEHPALAPLLEGRAAALRKLNRSLEADKDEARAAALKAAGEAAVRRDAAGPRYQGKTVGEWVQALGGPERMEAFGTLTQADKSAVPVLIELLRSDVSHIRTAAATAIARLGPDAQAAISALGAALKDKNLNVRYWAARALGAMGPAAETTVPALADALKTHPKTDPDLEGPPRYYKDARTAAAEALGMIGAAARAALPQLREALKDEESEVRSAAQQAVTRIEGK